MLSYHRLSATLPLVSNKKTSRLSLQLAIVALTRTFINTGIRMVYPFAPALSRGLGVEISSIYNLVTLRNFAGFISPLFGPFSEWFGRKPVMIGAMLLFALSSGIVVIWPAYWPLGAALILIALSKVIYDPAMQAYVGDVVPYKKRGMAFAVTELSWAGALLIGAPLVGFAIQKYGWQSPFIWLTLLGLIAVLLLWRIIPHYPAQSGSETGLAATWQVVRGHPVIWAAAAYSLLLMCANETFFIVYGDWMEGSYHLKLASLGLASGLIGGAEIVGELFAGWSVDRLGKRPVVIVTGLLNAALYLIIPHTGSSLTAALATLFLLFLFFEITVVGAVPLLSEIVPAARGAVMAIVLAAGALGRALGDIIGPKIWEAGGLTGNGTTAAIIMLLAILILSRWIREGHDPSAA